MICHSRAYLETVIRNPVYNRVTLYWVPKVFQDWFGFTLFYSAIARENSLHFLNESISTRSFALSRALSRLPVLAFGFSLNWLLFFWLAILISLFWWIYHTLSNSNDSDTHPACNKKSNIAFAHQKPGILPSRISFQNRNEVALQWSTKRLWLIVILYWKK